MYQSMSTIDAPEFINLQPLDINPLISKCEIKVLYVGENRNRTNFSKEVLTKMSTTLRGTPIVGTYNKQKEDFGDHGKKITIDREGVHKECTTRPYGFIPTDARVWFQKFEDYDEVNGKVIREYLMTEGYLWTGQYPECEAAIKGEGKGHSMEVDDDTFIGTWSRDYNSGIDFFIVNDAIFYKLCMLGDDVEPCFEGSSITAPKVSTSFSKEDSMKFATTFYSMMKEIQNTLNISEGGKTVVKTNQTSTAEPEEVMRDFSKEEDKKQEDKKVEDPKKDESEEPTPAPKKDDEKEDKQKPSADNALEKDKKEETPKQEEEPKKDDAPAPAKEDNKEEEKKKDYALLEQQYTELQTQYAALKETCDALTKFKNEVENKQKDDLIASFYMLDDEDKKNVIANKTQYSLDDIEKELSVICVRKKVNFNLDEDSKQEAPTTYNLNSDIVSEVPEWLQAVNAVKNRK